MSIRDKTKAFIKNFVIYGLGNIANKVITVVLIPVTTRYLLVMEVGLLALLEMLELFLTTILMMGIGNAVWRYLGRDTEENDRTIIFSAYIGRLAINILIVAVLIIFSDLITRFLNIPPEYLNLVILIIVNSLLVAASNFVLSLWRYFDHSLQFSIFSTARFFLIVSFSLYFVIVLDLRVLGIVYAKLIVNGLGFLYSILYVFIKYRSTISSSVYLKLQRYGFYFILLALVTPILNTANRLFINHFLTLDEVAIFSIAFKFGMLINILLVTPMQLAWLPMMYKLGTDTKSTRYYRDFAYYYTIIASLVFILIAIFREQLLLALTTADYLTGAKYIPMVAAAYLINGYRHFFMSGSAIKDKTSFLGYASIMTIIINLLLNNWLIGSFGIWGAVFTTLLSYIILSVTILMASQTIIKVNWGWPKISGVMLCMVIFILIHEYIISSNFLPNWTLKSIIFIGYILTLRLTGLISQKEIKGLLELMDKIMFRLAIKNSN